MEEGSLKVLGLSRAPFSLCVRRCRVSAWVNSAGATEKIQPGPILLLKDPCSAPPGPMAARAGLAWGMDARIKERSPCPHGTAKCGFSGVSERKAPLRLEPKVPFSNLAFLFVKIYIFFLFENVLLYVK